MVWCIEQADCGEEVVECLAESLSILEVCTTEPKLCYVIDNEQKHHLCHLPYSSLHLL